MKRSTTLLVLIISLALICGALAFAVYAEAADDVSAYPTATADSNRYEVVSGGVSTFYDASVTLQGIVDAAPSGSTIRFLEDVTEVTDRYENSNKAGEFFATNISVSKPLTFDLCGHTLTIVQRAKNCGFYINTTGLVTFKNGTVITSAHSDYNTANRTFAFCNVSQNGANIAFENVNSSVSALVYSYASDYTITVKGGIHSLDSSPGDMNTPGFISGQNNINATVSDAVIYANGRGIIGASSYKVASGAFKVSVFNFNNCKIISSSAETNIIGNANRHTTVNFKDCYVYGSLKPSLNASDSKVGIAASGANNFVLCENTSFSSDSNIAAATTLGSGVVTQETVEVITVAGVYYTFDRKADFLYAIWYDENGEVLKRVKLDSTVTTLEGLAPEYKGSVGFSNGWYKTGEYFANSWTDKKGGANEVDVSSIDLSGVTKNICFYPRVDESRISAHLNAAMYNLSTTGAIQINLYIPEAPDNVEILGVYVGEREISGKPILYSNYASTPVYYTMYVIDEVGATEFTKVTNVIVRYLVNGETELEQAYELSPEKYAYVVYEDSRKSEGNVYNLKAYNVVADLVRYSYMLSIYSDTTDNALTTLYAKMFSLCSKLPSDNELAGSLTNAFNLQGVGSIAYEASSYEPRWKFSINESAKIKDIKITLDGYKVGAGEDRINFSAQTYGIEDVSRNADGNITSAYTKNIPIYNITQPFTITCTKADGTEISGTYDLKSYYTATAKNTAAADFIKAVVSLSASSAAYKFPEGKITKNDIYGFWQCKHTNTVKQESIVSGTYNFHPRYCANCDSWLFYYEDYGAVADGKTNRTRATHVSGTNDYEAIYWTHVNANEWKAREYLSGGKQVAVVGNSDPSKAKYYYISLPEGRGIYLADANLDGIPETDYTDRSLGTIVIATDTSWNGVNFIIDDDTICNASGCTCVNSTGFARKHAYTSQPIFSVDEYGTENYTESLTGKIKSLSAGATNIGYAPGRKMLIKFTDSNKKIYLRYGANASSGAAVTEVILVDEFGNVDPSTPVQWDYATVTGAMAYSVDTDPIKISGLNGDSINSSFETYVNNSLTISIPHYVACNRGIALMRSNATVEGIDRYFTEEPANSNVTNKRFAYNFVNVSLCSKVTIKDMLVLNHNSQSGESGVSQGSYEFSGGNANAVSWINCVTKNMFSSTKDGTIVNAYPVYRGLFGTNHIRNMYLKDCYLNSFDAHTGAYNVTIEDTTVEHMNFIGGGKITIKNVTVYTASGGMAFNLRTDYGSTWKGDVDIDGLTVKYANASGYKPSRITIFSGSYTDQYYGFDTSTPQNVTINNFHVQAYTATVSGGVRTETPGAVDAIDVYYYYALRNLTDAAVPDASYPANTNGADSNGTNKLIPTESITITNSANIILPTGSFWKDMTVKVNGRLKKWVGGTDSGTWEYVS